jgi:toxin ParE1/3/4
LRINYKLNREAKEDLRNIYAFGYQKWGVEQADIYFNQLFVCFDKICQNPEQFPHVNEIRKGYQRCVCGVDSIYFRFNDNAIEIMRILGSQNL